MKAYLRRRQAAIAALALTTLLASSCTERPVEPPPPPPPPPAAPPPPPPAPAPRPEVDWRTAPITPGDWQWSNSSGQSVARFAGGLVVLSCNRPARQVTLERSGKGRDPVPMTIETSSETRPVAGASRPGPPPTIAVSFDANDPLLDAMAFSRGRFALATAGLPTLYVPSWPEVSRVIEDCR